MREISGKETVQSLSITVGEIWAPNCYFFLLILQYLLEVWDCHAENIFCPLFFANKPFWWSEPPIYWVVARKFIVAFIPYEILFIYYTLWNLLWLFLGSSCQYISSFTPLTKYWASIFWNSNLVLEAALVFVRVLATDLYFYN